MIKQEFTVLAVHGEADRDTVNRLQVHRNKVEMDRLRQYGAAVPDALKQAPNEPPDVLVVLRDDSHGMRIEWAVKTWEEVEAWKGIIGYDPEKRHFTRDTKVKVVVSDK